MSAFDSVFIHLCIFVHLRKRFWQLKKVFCISRRFSLASKKCLLRISKYSFLHFVSILTHFETVFVLYSKVFIIFKKVFMHLRKAFYAFQKDFYYFQEDFSVFYEGFSVFYGFLFFWELFSCIKKRFFVHIRKVFLLISERLFMHFKKVFIHFKVFYAFSHRFLCF